MRANVVVLASLAVLEATRGGGGGRTSSFTYLSSEHATQILRLWKPESWNGNVFSSSPDRMVAYCHALHALNLDDSPGVKAGLLSSTYDLVVVSIRDDTDLHVMCCMWQPLSDRAKITADLSRWAEEVGATCTY